MGCNNPCSARRAGKDYLHAVIACALNLYVGKSLYNLVFTMATSHPHQAATTVQITSVSTAEDQQKFLDVPYRVYKDDPYWVPPLRSSEAKHLADDNPFLRYGSLQAFIALDKGTPVGRVVASVNQRLIDREGYAVGLFGFFECVNDEAIAQALLDAASDWLKTTGNDPCQRSDQFIHPQ